MSLPAAGYETAKRIPWPISRKMLLILTLCVILGRSGNPIMAFTFEGHG